MNRVVLALLHGYFNSYKVVSCWYKGGDEQYEIGYQCDKCGSLKYARLASNKVTVLSCKCCTDKVYIVPLLSYNDNDHADTVVGFVKYLNADYNALKAQLKREGFEGSIIDYVNKSKHTEDIGNADNKV